MIYFAVAKLIPKFGVQTIINEYNCFNISEMANRSKISDKMKGGMKKHSYDRTFDESKRKRKGNKRSFRTNGYDSDFEEEYEYDYSFNGRGRRK